MRVIIFGASGMVGQGVLRECLLDPRVERVLSVGRSPSGARDAKLEDLVVPDVGDLSQVEDRLRAYDAAFFCLGVSSLGRSVAEYRRVTYDLTLGAARTLARLDPGMTFIYVSGAGTDSTEAGRTMWARVKGETENAILKLSFRHAYMFRPGAIIPQHGVRSKTFGYRLAYLFLWPFLGLLLRASPGSVTTTERVGRAMLRLVREGPPDPLVSTRRINDLGR